MISALIAQSSIKSIQDIKKLIFAIILKLKVPSKGSRMLVSSTMQPLKRTVNLRKADRRKALVSPHGDSKDQAEAESTNSSTDLAITKLLLGTLRKSSIGDYFDGRDFCRGHLAADATQLYRSTLKIGADRRAIAFQIIKLVLEATKNR